MKIIQLIMTNYHIDELNELTFIIHKKNNSSRWSIYNEVSTGFIPESYNRGFDMENIVYENNTNDFKE